MCGEQQPVIASAFAVALLALAVAPAPARAQHEHHHAPAGPIDDDGAAIEAEEPPPFRAAVSAVAARFDTRLYEGDYQGLGVAGAWSSGRFGVHAAVTFYRLQGNGLSRTGLGDVMAGGHVALIAERRLQAGLGLMASLPTGESL